MLTLVGNKYDIYEYEEAEESEGEIFAKEFGCIFQKISTKNGPVIDTFL